MSKTATAVKSSNKINSKKSSKTLTDKEKQARSQRAANLNRQPASNANSHRATAKTTSKATPKQKAVSKIKDAPELEATAVVEQTPDSEPRQEIGTAEGMGGAPNVSTPDAEPVAPIDPAALSAEASVNEPSVDAPTAPDGKTASVETDTEAEEMSPDTPPTAATIEAVTTVEGATPSASAPLDKAERKVVRERLEIERKAQVAANRERIRADRAAAKVEWQQAKPVKPDLGERYNRAAERVSLASREFIEALDAKAKFLNVVRVGEAVTATNAELDALNVEITAARDHLQSLLQRRREFKTASPELREIQQRISRARKERNLARAEKKAALAEATANTSTANTSIASQATDGEATVEATAD